MNFLEYHLHSYVDATSAEPISGYMYLTKGLGIPFMMQAWWLFVICTVIYFVISHFTQRPPKEIIDKYTWDSPLSVLIRDKFSEIKDARLWAGVLILSPIILYSIFS